MKISVFGKSGPRLVTTGLVCASDADCPAAIQPAAASATTNPRKRPDMPILPVRPCFAVAYHDAGLCRVPSIGLNLTWRGSRDFKPARQRAIYRAPVLPMTRAGDVKS